MRIDGDRTWIEIPYYFIIFKIQIRTLFKSECLVAASEKDLK
jgi:hypothetical protein